MTKATPYPDKVLNDTGKQRTFTKDNNLQIAFPMGGLGAGMICLNGYGGIQDFAIRNQPATSATPDGHGTSDAAFATLHINNSITKLVEGPMPREKVYNLGTKGQGFREGGFEGLPRFEDVSFTGEYPFGHITLKDPNIPLQVQITGFNPFIPLDDKNASLPCAILEYTFTNRSKSKVDYEFAYHLCHFAPGTAGGKNSRNTTIPGGVYLYNVEHKNDAAFGGATLTAIGHRPKTKAMWFRGGWFDSISALWREVSTGTFKTNPGNETENLTGRNGGSILLSGSLKKGESITYPILITWYFPNCHYTARRDENNKEAGGSTCCDDNPPPPWRPYYAGQWTDAADVAAYVRQNYASLRSRTQAFHDALFSSTLPAYVLDAVSANLGILKSPTFLRQENGNAWAWEGCFVDRGCCAGSCTHVWNYAQAFPHLYPNIERTFREQELERTMDRRGHVTFRAALPDGEVPHTFHAAADGQLGGVMKVYREWQISGDEKWLKKMYPLAKRSLNYCIKIWDPDHKGVLIEPHHNTYDIEFWGADGMCTSIYLGALAAMAEMARDVSKPDEATFYQDLGKKGAAYLDKHLFNGEYYYQKVQYKGLRNKSFEKLVAKVNRNSGEVEKLLKREGPKYQYGTGCISDGVIGAWMAKIYGIPTAQNRTHTRRTLKAIFQYNFRHDLFDHACTQRPGYANGHEPGLLLCSWPRGKKPTLPFVYSDEVWTGIEYQVASHLIEEGLVKEGLTIVKAVRERHNGRVRNPYNEYECGNYYARALASYAVLNSLSGFNYSRAKKTLHLSPKLQNDRFKTFFSTATGFGTLTLTKTQLIVEPTEGELEIEKLYVNGKRVKLPQTIHATAQKRTTIRR